MGMKESIVIWPLRTKGEEFVLPHGGEGRLSLAFSDDGRYALTARTGIGSNDDTIRKWDIKTGRETACVSLKEIVSSGSFRTSDCFAFSPDGRLAAFVVVAPHEVVLIDLDRRRKLTTLYQRGEVADLAFSPDGCRLTVAWRPSSRGLYEYPASRPGGIDIYALKTLPR